MSGRNSWRRILWLEFIVVKKNNDSSLFCSGFYLILNHLNQMYDGKVNIRVFNLFRGNHLQDFKLNWMKRTQSHSFKSSTKSIFVQQQNHNKETKIRFFFCVSNWHCNPLTEIAIEIISIWSHIKSYVHLQLSSAHQFGVRFSTSFKTQPWRTRITLLRTAKHAKNPNTALSAPSRNSKFWNEGKHNK